MTGRAVPWPVKALFFMLAAGMLFTELRLPGAPLDPSWMLATQYGLLHHIDFGRYLLISYGPLSVLTSGLFHPSTAWLTITFQLICVVIVFWPIVHLRWSVGVLAALVVCVIVDRVNYLNDGIVFAAIFSSFLLGMQGRRAAALLSAIAIGVFSLSKTSFFFAAAPLFILADAHGLLRARNWPLQLLVLFASLSVAFVICGQPPLSLLLYLRNGYQISSGYLAAMNLPIRSYQVAGLLAFVALSGALVGLLLWHANATRSSARAMALQPAKAPTLAAGGAGATAESVPNTLTFVTAAIGFAWLTFVVYKASYARIDPEHGSIGWNALLLLTPVTLLVSRHLRGTAAQSLRTDIVWPVTACAVFLLTTDGFGAFTPALVGEKFANVAALAGWLRPAKWQLVERQRVEALEHIAVRGLDIGHDSVDVYPYEVSRVIAAGLNYQPRPAFQSYLSYSPFMQTLDLEHWRSAAAPRHVLFALADIDGRLPTLSLGPSIVELLSRYDSVGPVGPTTHLRRRVTAREVARQSSAAVSQPMGAWIAIPNVSGRLTLASIQLDPTLWERLTAFLDRPAFLNIEVRLATGAVQRYRFIPAMARLGFAISPELSPLFAAPAGFDSDLTNLLQGSTPIEAFRITGSPGAVSSYDRMTVAFTTVQFSETTNAYARDN